MAPSLVTVSGGGIGGDPEPPVTRNQQIHNSLKELDHIVNLIGEIVEMLKSGNPPSVGKPTDQKTVQECPPMAVIIENAPAIIGGMVDRLYAARNELLSILF